MPFPTTTKLPPATNPGRGSDRELQNHTLRNPSNRQTSARFSIVPVGRGSCRAQTVSQAAILYFHRCVEDLRTPREALTTTNSPARPRRSREKIRARREPRPTGLEKARRESRPTTGRIGL